MSSSSYPRVHVVGSGAYYSYRPITRNIEKVTRNYIRDCSSRPKEFAQYLAASTSHGDGFKRAPSSPRDYARGVSLPPFDSTERKRASDKDDDSFFKRGGDDSFSKRGGDDSFSRRGGNDSLFKSNVEDSFMRRKGETSSTSSSDKRRVKSSYINQSDDEVVLNRNNDALFTTTDDTLTRLRKKHPYRLPVENEVTAPHESSIWPENRPHFDLVSSYDVMVDYLGIRDKSKK